MRTPPLFNPDFRLLTVRFEFLKCYDKLLRHAGTMVYRKEDAEDLVQSTYLRALVYINNYNPDYGRALPYLKRIMYSVYVEAYRKTFGRHGQHKRRMLSLD